MNIGDTQIGIVFAVRFYDEFFKGLHRQGIFPAQFTSTVATPVGELLATTLLNPPAFELISDATQSYTRLSLNGTVELRADPEAEPLATYPLQTSVFLSLQLRAVDGAAPVLHFVYGGVDQPPDPPLTAAMVNDAFTTDPIATLLNEFELDIITPVIEALTDLRFAEGNAPPADTWDTALRLLPETGSNWDAVCVYVALPETLQDLGDEFSFLPRLNEFGVIYDRTLMNFVLSAAASEQEGTEIEGATITQMSLSMGDNSLLVDGRAERDGGVVTFSGPIDMALIRGTDVFAVDTSGVDVDVDLPWYLDVLMFFTGPVGGILTLGLGPLIGEAILASKDTSSGEVHASLASVPGLVRGGIARTLASELDVLTEALHVEGEFGELAIMSSNDQSLIRGGSIGVFAQVLVNPISDLIIDGVYSNELRRFAEFRLAGGRQFSSPELSRFVDAEMITTPGYHAVHRVAGEELRFMRADPDDALANNLLERFTE
jgi:hypothetical protein